jgi:CAAX prenyl protease-like protein
MANAREHGWWPYLVPYGVFLLLVEIGVRLPEGLALAAMGLRVVVPGALIVWFWRAGCYPELRGYRFGIGTLADLAMGVLIAIAWVAPFALFPELSRGDEFEAGAAGSPSRGATLGLRLVGFALVTPFVEELFVRSFLHRYIQVWDGRGHFLDLPVERFAPLAFVVTTVWFTFSHARWEWGVAAVAGVLFNLWLYQRRHIGGVIVAHAAANASIWFWVVLGPAGYWAFL